MYFKYIQNFGPICPIDASNIYLLDLLRQNQCVKDEDSSRQSLLVNRELLLWGIFL